MTIWQITTVVYLLHVLPVVSEKLEIRILYGEDMNFPLVSGTWSFAFTAAALPMAIEDFQKKGWLSQLNIRIIRVDGGCSPKVALHKTSEIYYKQRPDVLFGYSCSSALKVLGMYAANWNLPLFTHGGINSVLNNKERYATLVRFHPSGENTAEVFVDLLRKFNWRRVAMVSSDGACDSTGPSIRTRLQEDGVLITDFIQATRELVPDYKLNFYLERIKERARIIIFCIFNNVSKLRFMRLAYEKHMYPGYVFLGFYSSPAVTVYRPWEYDPSLTQAKAQEWRHIALTLNYKCSSLALADGKPIDDFYERYPSYLAGPPFYYNHTLLMGWSASYKAVDLYDLTMTYLTVLNETLNEGKGAEYYQNGTYMMDRVRGKTISGLRGKFRFDRESDQIPNQWLWSMSPGEDELSKVAIVNMAEATDKRFEYLDGRTLYWDTPDGTVPPDTPPCGFRGEFCRLDDAGDSTSLVVGAVFGVLVIVITAIILAVFIRKNQYEAALQKMTWKINYEDISRGNRQPGSSLYPGTSQFIRSSAYRRGVEGEGINSSILPSEDHGVNEEMFLRESSSTLDDEAGWWRGQFYTEVGMYQGVTVAIHRSYRQDISLTRTDLVELKVMRDMSHENLAMFVGACTEPPNICYMTVYCPKGSIQDIIQNDDVKLDWTFQSSLISDMCNGLAYIHKSYLGSHGKLRSSCCLVDSRWQLKISCYGLHTFRAEGDEDTENYDKLLWTAPELLRHEMPRYGTKKGDIYSFGIITHEMIYRTSRLSINPLLTSEDVVEKVMSQRRKPYRPELGKLDHDVHPDVKVLMSRCWEEDPEKRPSCDVISKLLVKMNAGKEFDMMENILEKLQKYATNLEDIVEQRTAELVTEKKRTDSLLYRMLPESIAEHLKQGKGVKAELYDEVTVYFSDIVGFTDLSQASSPLQIVNLLNDLYSMFDDMISLHDVYKVETISDSYMVVSGLPRRNCGQHVGEIANLALELMSAAITRFRIRHKPGVPLQLRVGFHTGPCAAGVVGLSMPRYCLFGDTVNMASRMETNGRALGIHMSRAAYEALRVLGDYKIKPRGEMHIKGKGMQMTYWLVGRGSFDKPLPAYRD